MHVGLLFSISNLFGSSKLDIISYRTQ